MFYVKYDNTTNLFYMFYIYDYSTGYTLLLSVFRYITLFINNLSIKTVIFIKTPLIRKVEVFRHIMVVKYSPLWLVTIL